MLFSCCFNQVVMLKTPCDCIYLADLLFSVCVTQIISGGWVGGGW
jgi:hypothetical protein